MIRTKVVWTRVLHRFRLFADLSEQFADLSEQFEFWPIRGSKVQINQPAAIKIQMVQLNVIQGEPTQSVKSNLAMTDRKNTTNFNLIANYIQGRLGIYAWMINEIPSWPLLASVTSNFTIHIFTWLAVWSKMPKIAKPQTASSWWFDDFLYRF